MELHIDGQHIEIHDALRDMIHSRLEKLNSSHDDIIHARVALVKSLHHQHGSDEARITLSMSRRKVLQSTRVGKTLEDAVNSAFDALQREISHYRGRRRELNKQRLKATKVAPQITGKVVEVVPEQGYGYVDIGSGEPVYFARQIVVGAPFEEIRVGTAVEVDVVEAARGYEATRVVPLEG